MIHEITKPMARILRVAGRNGGNYHFKKTELPAVKRLASLGLLKYQDSKKGPLLTFTKAGYDAAKNKSVTRGRRLEIA